MGIYITSPHRFQTERLCLIRGRNTLLPCCRQASRRFMIGKASLRAFTHTPLWLQCHRLLLWHSQLMDVSQTLVCVFVFLIVGSQLEAV